MHFGATVSVRKRQEIHLCRRKEKTDEETEEDRQSEDGKFFPLFVAFRRVK